jgi:hypothetical protein
MESTEKGCYTAIGALLGAVLVAGIIGTAWVMALMVSQLDAVLVMGLSELERGLRFYGFLLECLIEVARWFLETFVPFLRPR